jgi:hypothetical protein
MRARFALQNKGVLDGRGGVRRDVPIPMAGKNFCGPAFLDRGKTDYVVRTPQQLVDRRQSPQVDTLQAHRRRKLSAKAKCSGGLISRMMVAIGVTSTVRCCGICRTACRLDITAHQPLASKLNKARVHCFWRTQQTSGPMSSVLNCQACRLCGIRRIT